MLICCCLTVPCDIVPLLCIVVILLLTLPFIVVAFPIMPCCCCTLPLLRWWVLRCILIVDCVNCCYVIVTRCCTRCCCRYVYLGGCCCCYVCMICWRCPVATPRDVVVVTRYIVYLPCVVVVYVVVVVGDACFVVVLFCCYSVVMPLIYCCYPLWFPLRLYGGVPRYGVAFVTPLTLPLFVTGCVPRCVIRYALVLLTLLPTLDTNDLVFALRSTVVCWCCLRVPALNVTFPFTPLRCYRCCPLPVDCYICSAFDLLLLYVVVAVYFVFVVTLLQRSGADCDLFVHFPFVEHFTHVTFVYCCCCLPLNSLLLLRLLPRLPRIATHSHVVPLFLPVAVTPLFDYVCWLPLPLGPRPIVTTLFPVTLFDYVVVTFVLISLTLDVCLCYRILIWWWNDCYRCCAVVAVADSIVVLRLVGYCWFYDCLLLIVTLLIYDLLDSTLPDYTFSVAFRWFIVLLLRLRCCCVVALLTAFGCWRCALRWVDFVRCCYDYPLCLTVYGRYPLLLWHATRSIRCSRPARRI